MALIDKTTDITSFDYKKVRKTNTTENGTFKTNQKNNSEKNTSFDEGRVQQQYTKLSPDEDQFLKKEPGDRYRGTNLDDGLYRGGAVLNVERNVEDTARIGKFLTTPKGLLFTGKQVILQKQNASEHTKGYKVISPITNRPPFTRDERHKAGGLFSSPFSEAPRYEDDNILKDNKIIEKEGFKPSAVQPIQLRKGYGTTPSKRLEVTVNADGTQFNPNDDRQISKLNVGYKAGAEEDNRSKAGLPKDFIKFRIRDMVNKKWIIFPAYLTDITDNSSAEYNPTRYIGRPDQVFVYSGYTRNIGFGFRVAALTKSDLKILWEKVDKLKGLALPTFSKKVIQNDDELRPIAPFVELTIGDLLYEQPGYFSGINVTIPQTSTWEVDGAELPHLCDVSCEFVFVGNKLPQAIGNQYDIPGGSAGELTKISNKQASKNKYNPEKENKEENK